MAYVDAPFGLPIRKWRPVVWLRHLKCWSSSPRGITYRSVASPYLVSRNEYHSVAQVLSSALHGLTDPHAVCTSTESRRENSAMKRK
jgi:hypothetical protein